MNIFWSRGAGPADSTMGGSAVEPGCQARVSGATKAPA